MYELLLRKTLILVSKDADSCIKAPKVSMLGQTLVATGTVCQTVWCGLRQIAVTFEADVILAKDSHIALQLKH